MTDQNQNRTQDDIAGRVAALNDEFPGYQFSWTSNDDQSAGRYSISAQETESWSYGEVQSASGDTIDDAIAAIRSVMGGMKG